MFIPNDSEEIPFRNAIRAAISVITDKIISSDSDLVGLCLYKTRESKNASENIYVLIDLDIPDVSMISELEKLLNLDFEQVYGHCEDDQFFFGNALWACSSIFSNCTTKVGHKRIFLFTNDDSPHQEDDPLRDKSIQRAKDISDIGVEIELFPMNKKDSQFDILKFYRYIITIDEDEITGEFKYDGANKFEELKSKVRRKEFKKRSLGKLTMRLSEKIEIGVRLYNIVQEAKKDTPKRLDESTNKPVKTITKKTCKETNSILLESQIKYGYEHGGKLLKFEKEEAKNMKVITEPGVTVLGFKPRTALKDYHNLKYSSFIYPDEPAVSGSTVLFASLLDRMLKLDKIAICNVTPRSNAACRFAALLPSKEKIDEDGIQQFPPGFHIIWLPFSEDIKPVNIPEVKNVDNDDVERARAIVDKLRIRFDARNFENPVLQVHYSTLYALALDKTEEEIGESVDLLLPDLEGMAKYSHLIEDFKSNIFPDDYTPDIRSPNKKRKRGGDDDDIISPRKVTKVREIEDWKKLVDSGEIKKVGVVELREYCSLNGIRNYSKLKKAELVETVSEHIKKSE